jgi:hypothetical protein
MGDKRALLFLVYEANRGRSPARRLVQLVRRTFEQATEPKATHPEPAAQPVRHRDSMEGYGQHPLGGAHAAAPRLADFIGAEAGRTALRLAAAREAAEAEAQAPAAPAVDEAPAAAPVAPFRPARRRPDPFRARLLGGTSLCAGVEPRDRRAAGRRPLGP